MTFLVTGATGFIGRRVVQSAVEQGHNVAILTRSVSAAQELFGKYDENIITIDLGEFLSGRARLDTAIYNKVIHLAWADVKNYMDNSNLTDNLEFQLDFLNKIIASGIHDLTLTGTCLEYGMTEGKCVETAIAQEPFPTSYAKAKHSLYLKLLELQRNNQELSIKWLRLFYVYGIGQRPNSLLCQLLKAIENKEKEINMSMGDQMRDFINVETLAHNIIAVANQNQQTGIINAGSGKTASVLEFIERILELKKYDLKLNKGYYPYSNYEPHSFWADVTKLKTINGTKFDQKIWL